MLTLAKAYLDKLEGKCDRVVVPANQVHLEAEGSQDINLGPVRLPVLIRAAEFTKARSEPGRESLTLEEFIGFHIKPPHISADILHDIMMEHIDKHNVVLIIDGLDETVDRQSVASAVKSFVRNNIPLTAPIYSAPPYDIGLNQVIVTSRIAGYHYDALLGNFTHVTIEHMDKVSINYFSESWMKAVYKLINKSESEALEKAKEFQQTVYDHKHPGIFELATNPLMVTVLLTIFHNNSGTIPEIRVQLYQYAVEYLIKEWKQVSNHQQLL